MGGVNFSGRGILEIETIKWGLGSKMCSGLGFVFVLEVNILRDFIDNRRGLLRVFF